MSRNEKVYREADCGPPAGGSAEPRRGIVVISDRIYKNFDKDTFMKKLFRMIIFSGVAIFLTALWNKGFIVKSDPMVYLKAALIIAAVYYLIVPASKLVLLPLNLLTFGLVSVIFYAVIFYFLLNRFNLIEIKEWVFPGAKILGIVLGKIKISGTSNIFISSFSISTIINFLEKTI